MLRQTFSGHVDWWMRDDGSWEAWYLGAGLFVKPDGKGFQALVRLDGETLYDRGPMPLASAKLSCRGAAISAACERARRAGALGADAIEAATRAGAAALAALILEVPQHDQMDVVRMFLQSWGVALVASERAACVDAVTREQALPRADGASGVERLAVGRAIDALHRRDRRRAAPRGSK